MSPHCGGKGWCSANHGQCTIRADDEQDINAYRGIQCEKGLESDDEFDPLPPNGTPPLF